MLACLAASGRYCVGRARFLLTILADNAGSKTARSRAMDQYFIDNRSIPEPEASTVWFDYAERNGIEVPRAISLWEDASTPEGEASRQAVAKAGIRVVVDGHETAARDAGAAAVSAPAYSKKD
jgi:hypothetical protein